MAIIRCVNGHFYNTDFYVDCPFCKSALNDSPWESDRGYDGNYRYGERNDNGMATPPVNRNFSAAEDDDVTVPLMNRDRFTASAGTGFEEEDDDVTVPLMSRDRFAAESRSSLSSVPAEQQEQVSDEREEDEREEDEGRTVAILPGQRPRVTGWLVCVEGEHKGRAFRIHEDNNLIGTDGRNDICLKGASMVEAYNHCSIIYDRKNVRFYLLPGEDAYLRLNGTATDSIQPLSKGDRVMIGRSVFEFVPFCKENHTWKW